MAKLRRGVTLEQTRDDLDRIMNIQDIRSATPVIGDQKDAKLVVLDDGSGEIYFQIGGKLWKLTATEVT